MREGSRRPDNEFGNQKNPGAETSGGFEISETNLEQREGLEEVVQKRVGQWADAWLEQLYNNPPPAGSINSFDSDRYLAHVLDGLTEGQAPDSFEDNRITPAYRTAVETFYKRVVDFAGAKVTSGEHQQETQNFLKNINQAFFSISGGTADHMGLAHHLLFTAKTNRIPELQGWFGQQFTEEVVYKLSFCDDAAVDHLIEQVQDQPVAELIDVIDQLKTVAAHAMVYAYSEEEGFSHSVKIIEALKDSSQSPLVWYAADAALARLEQEQEEPTYSIVTTHAAATDSRLPERLSQQYTEDHRRLSRQIKSDVPIQRGSIFTPISKDTVGMLDHSNMLYAVGRVDIGALNEAVKVPPQAIENIRDFLRHEKNPHPEKLRDLLGVTIQNVLAPRQGKEFIPVADLPEAFHQISPALTVEQYRQLFEQIVAREKWEDAQRNYQGQITQEAEHANLEISSRFLQDFFTLAEQLANEQSVDFSWVRPELEKFDGYMQKQNTELAMKRAKEFCDRLEFPLRIKTDQFIKTDDEGNTKLERNNITRDQIAQIKPEWSPQQVDLVFGLIQTQHAMRDGHSATWSEWEEKKNSHFYDNGSPEALAQMSAYDDIMRRFAKHYPQFSRHLSRFLKEVEEGQSSQLTSVHFSRVSELAKDKKLMPFAASDAQDVPILLADLHRPALRTRVEQDLGVSLTELTLSSQIHFLRFLAGQNKEGYEKLKTVLDKSEGFRVELLNSFLVVSEDTAYGQHILALAERLSGKPDVAKKVFAVCNDFIDRAQGKAAEILSELQTEFPDLELTEDVVTLALLSRGKDFLVELNQQADTGKSLPKFVNEFVAELTDSSLRGQMMRTHFKAMAELLSSGNVDLSKLEQRQALILRSLLKNPEQKQIMLSTLSRMGKLEPIPEIHWRVDRSLAEYNRRFGIDVIGFLKEKALQKPHQKLLEIGPGSGASKEERAKAGLGDLYNELALSDKIYYPLAPVVEKLLDFEKLKTVVGEELNPQDRKLLADYIYKCIIIAKGQTAQDQFEYNTEHQKTLASDVNELKTILPTIGNDLQVAEMVPQHISSHDAQGKVVYPYKIKASEQSEGFKKAKTLLGENLTSFLKSDWQETDYHQLIEAFPPNVMIGDLQDIKRLSPGQIDVEMAVRSTVYNRGEEYVRFLTSLFSRLAEHGVAIDDSIRDNDGWYYRIAEVWEAKKRMQGVSPEVLVVLGPGFEGEDARQDLVPLAMMVTKNGSSRELAEKYLQQGYQLRALEDLAANTEYLKTLDKTGWTAQRCQEAVTLESIVI
jgi:hypothetical protein